MELNNNHLIIGIVIIMVLLGFYIYYINNSAIKEGFSDSSDFAKSIKSKNDQIKDELLVGKYRTEYENILMDMDEYVNLVVLKELVNGMGLKDKNDITMADIDTLQQYKHLRENIEDTMKFMDSV